MLYLRSHRCMKSNTSALSLTQSITMDKLEKSAGTRGVYYGGANSKVKVHLTYTGNSHIHWLGWGALMLSQLDVLLHCSRVLSTCSSRWEWCVSVESKVHWRPYRRGRFSSSLGGLRWCWRLGGTRIGDRTVNFNYSSRYIWNIIVTNMAICSAQSYFYMTHLFSIFCTVTLCSISNAFAGLSLPSD